MKQTYALDFEELDKIIINVDKQLPIIKVEDKPYSKHLFLKDEGKIIIYYTDKNELTLDLSQCTNIPNIKQKLNSPLFLQDNDFGKMRLPKTWRLPSIALSNKLAQNVLSTFKSKVLHSGIGENQNFVIKIKGKSALVHMKNGDLTLGPHQNKITDEIYNFVENFLKKNIEQNKIKIEEILLKKEDYETFLKQNIGNDICKYVSKDIYNFLSGKDIQEIQDGMTIYSLVSNTNPGLHNNKILVRSFSIAYEGFLIKFFLEIGELPLDDYQQDPSSVKMGKLLNNSLSNHAQLIERKHKGVIDKARYLWKECRNNYMHSDMYSFSKLENLEQAKAKIVEILGLMEQMIDCIKLIKEPLHK